MVHSASCLLTLLAVAPVALAQTPNPWWQGPWNPQGGWGTWGKPSLNSKDYQRSITLEGLLTHSKALAQFASANGNTRSFGTKGYNMSADYVERIAKENDYEVYRQSVPYPSSSFISNSLVVNGKAIEGGSANLVTFTYSSGTPTEGVTGPAHLVGGLGCTAEEFAGSKGTIAFAKRGNCTFIDRALLAKQAGVAALVIFNNVAGIPISSRLDSNYALNPPTLSLSQEAALPIVAALAAGQTFEATVKVDIKNEILVADNVIAETKWGNKNQVVFVGAHLDSVPAGPGINDDGSGTATMAELLKQLARFQKGKNAVRFAWWSTEEVGLVGSRYYVEHLSQAEKDKILVYSNFDMTASPNYILGIHDGDNSAGGNSGVPAPPGSAALEKLFEGHFDGQSLNHTAYAFSSGSDYRGFLDAGIVAGGIATGAGGFKTAREVELFGGSEGVAYDECYHQLCDDIDNLAHDAYVWVARAAADIIATLSLDESPITKEQGIAAAGLNIGPSNLRGAKEVVSVLGHDCGEHVEL